MDNKKPLPTNQEIINQLKPLAKKLGIQSILVSIEQWDGSTPFVDAKLYSKMKNPVNNQYEWSISASTPYPNFSIEALCLKLEAEYLENEDRKKD